MNILRSCGRGDERVRAVQMLLSLLTWRGSRGKTGTWC